MLRRLGLPVLVLVASGCSSGSGSGSSDESTRTADPTAASSAPSDLPLPARWWEWADEFRPSADAIADATGASCARHQPEDVWFLAGTYGGSATRSCTVPEDRPVYFPVINQLCPMESGWAEADAEQSCPVATDVLEATLDGEPLEIEEEGSGVFTFVGRQNSTLGMPEGPTDAYAWGHWVGPLQLTAGRHLLHFRGRSDSLDVEVTYRLTVQ